MCEVFSVKLYEIMCFVKCVILCHVDFIRTRTYQLNVFRPLAFFSQTIYNEKRRDVSYISVRKKL